MRANMRNQISFLSWREKRKKSNSKVCFCCLQTPRILTLVAAQFLSFLCSGSRWTWTAIIGGSNVVTARLKHEGLFSGVEFFWGGMRCFQAEWRLRSRYWGEPREAPLDLKSLKRLYTVPRLAGYRTTISVSNNKLKKILYKLVCPIPFLCCVGTLVTLYRTGAAQINGRICSSALYRFCLKMQPFNNLSFL